MGRPSSHEVTELLRAWSQGDESALEKLVPVVYDELHRLAHRYMAREQPGHTLQTTALLNEVYLRLVDSRQVTWQDRAHFFGAGSRAMRQILVDWARARRSLKRGGEARRQTLDEKFMAFVPRSADLLAVDDALKALSAVDPRKAQVVELRFFGGLSVGETAEVLEVSRETVMRDWKLAKGWLRREMRR
jgi:RNA polymerase sigma-70 factor (ECF subfamily)